MKFAATLSLILSLSLQRSTAWRAVMEMDRWWETVFKDLESHDAGTEYFLPGPPRLYGGMPMMKVMVINRCNCETACKEASTPADAGGVDESYGNPEATESADPAPPVDESTNGATPEDGENKETREPTSSTSDTILPPRYQPQEHYAEPPSQETGSPDVSEQSEPQREIASNPRMQRRLKVFFDGLPSATSRKAS